MSKRKLTRRELDQDLANLTEVVQKGARDTARTGYGMWFAFIGRHINEIRDKLGVWNGREGS